MATVDIHDAVLQPKSEIELASNRTLLQKLGIGYSHFRLLKTIAHIDYPTQQDVAKSLNQSQPAVSRQIKLLVDQGLVSVVVNPENRRTNRLTVTKKGKKLAISGQKIAHQNFKKLFQDLDKDTIHQATIVLYKMINHLKKNIL